MRVLVVAANQEQKPDPVVPLGAAFVASAARAAGHEVRLFDACFLGDRVLAELSRELHVFRPDVVGLSMRNVDDVCWPRAHSYFPYYRRAVAAIRSEAPHAALVLGGSAFTLMPEKFMDALSPDFGVAGEGEIAFPGLLSRLEAGADGPRLVFAEPRGFPEVRPAFDLIDVDQYYRRGGALNVQTSRGCAFKCGYCTYPLLEGAQARRRSLEEVIDELEEATRRHGARHFFVVDNTFNHPAEHAFAFCDELIRRDMNVSWTAYASPASMADGLLERMAQAGCSSVEFGTDAAAPATLAALGKSFDAEAILDVSRRARIAGLKFAHSLILGGPDETLFTLGNTVEVIERAEPDAVFAMLGVRLYPGTALAKRAEREGLITEGELGIDPLFYVSEAVEPELYQYAVALKQRHPNWYFPGVEGNRWVRFWRRRRAHGVRGPLWEWMGEARSEPKGVES